MEKFNLKDVEKAYETIRTYIQPTPLVKSFHLANDDKNYFFKLESMHIVKNFKIRGALNKMLSLTKEEKELGVATVSSGNHGSSVSYASKLLGIKKAEIIVPKNTPKSKIDKIKYYGANVILMGNNYDEAHELGLEYIKSKKMTYIDSYYDDEKIYAGQGTIALEILKQNEEIDTIIVPIGGGGLIGGIAMAAKSIKPSIKIIGVQTEACPAMLKSLEDNVLYDKYPTEDSICDSLVGGVGALSFEILKEYIDDIIIVSEESIKKAVSFMVKKEKIVAEPGSSTTVAAVQEFGNRIEGKNIALIISGSNIDEELLLELMNKY